MFNNARSVVFLLLLLPVSALSQRGKEQLGASTHAVSVKGDPCKAGLAESIWDTQHRPTDQKPAMAKRIARFKGCGLGTKPEGNKKPEESGKPVYSSVIIQGAIWDYDTDKKSVVMLSSEWQVYHPGSKGLDEDEQKGYPRKPLLYGDSKVLFLGLSCFLHSGNYVDPAGKVDVSYKITTTQVTPANLANLKSVLEAWLGVKAGVTAGEVRNDVCQEGLLAIYEITDKLPYDISITPSAKIIGTDPPKQTQDCSADTTASCTNSARTFHNLDVEFWDLSAASALPGVREPQYSPSNPAVQTAATRHNDFYLNLDLYPFAPIANKTSWLPHLAVGIPVTGKVFYRPFFGIAESVTGAPYFQSHNIPQISLLFGVVYLNQQLTIPNPSGSGLAIGHSRVRKGSFGLEISLSPLLNKIKAIGGGGGSSNTGNTGNTGKNQTGSSN